MTTGSSLFTGISSGLSNTYALLAQAYGASGVTQSNILAAMSNSKLVGTLNPTFASYMQTNFSTLDTNKDGTLCSAELANMTNIIATQGLTLQQLTQLGPAIGLSGDTLSQVLEHFSDIDANHDGKVTQAEIQSFSLKSAEEKKKTELASKAAANMSVFYGDDDSSANVNTTSLLDFKYMNSGNNSSSSTSNT